MTSTAELIRQCTPSEPSVGKCYICIADWGTTVTSDTNTFCLTHISGSGISCNSLGSAPYKDLSRCQKGKMFECICTEAVAPEIHSATKITKRKSTKGEIKTCAGAGIILTTEFQAQRTPKQRQNYLRALFPKKEPVKSEWERNEDGSPNPNKWLYIWTSNKKIRNGWIQVHAHVLHGELTAKTAFNIYCYETENPAYKIAGLMRQEQKGIIRHRLTASVNKHLNNAHLLEEFRSYFNVWPGLPRQHYDANQEIVNHIDLNDYSLNDYSLNGYDLYGYDLNDYEWSKITPIEYGQTDTNWMPLLLLLCTFLTCFACFISFVFGGLLCCFISKQRKTDAELHSQV